MLPSGAIFTSTVFGTDKPDAIWTKYGYHMVAFISPTELEFGVKIAVKTPIGKTLDCGFTVGIWETPFHGEQLNIIQAQSRTVKYFEGISLSLENTLPSRYRRQARPSRADIPSPVWRTTNTRRSRSVLFPRPLPPHRKPTASSVPRVIGGGQTSRQATRQHSSCRLDLHDPVSRGRPGWERKATQINNKGIQHSSYQKPALRRSAVKYHAAKILCVYHCVRYPYQRYAMRMRVVVFALGRSLLRKRRHESAPWAVKAKAPLHAVPDWMTADGSGKQKS
ncbi:uncharacterized protein CLUP02_00474 [Colletotrichum lupini]|uniref:Uncharacterized protein n=1 Tax=Colletotrichum lupini TaxID=145971 RepID=A0A9Q8SAE7_9PEZI|nr:uncharacterized protein CLUP02_00474 [Colletotrichum lupini]UQC73827.1 hypothetical protein CLUP02_00474 [Colletotrichum lupini]